MKFSALYVDFSSPSSSPLGSRRPSQVGVKNGYPRKSGYFTAFISCSMKTAADRYRHLLIITSTGDKLFIGVNVDDIE